MRLLSRSFTLSSVLCAAMCLTVACGGEEDPIADDAGSSSSSSGGGTSSGESSSGGGASSGDAGSSSGELSSSGGTSSGDGGSSSGELSSSGGGSGAAPSNNDGVQNGDETDVDCGGTSGNQCAEGQGCAVAADCSEGVCGADGMCAAPSNNDGVRNGDETDVDCGGSSGNQCAAGLRCAVHADCASDGCGDDQRCALSRSCTAQNGGRTCGPGETVLNNAQHESCCETLPVPTANNIKLDKYNITAGRMRAFVERTNGNIRGWIEANKPDWWRDSWTDYLPTGMNAPEKVVDGVNRNYGVYGQLGGAYLYNQVGNAGCWAGENATGAPTYYIPLAQRRAIIAGDGGNRYEQAVLDQKSLNCANALMIAAFCAWDGGRLPTINELDAAWGNATYPWGEEHPAGYLPAYPSPNYLIRHNGLAPLTEASGIRNGDPLRANYIKNYPQTGQLWTRLGGLRGFGPANAMNGYDLAFHIAPPGRFPAGAGPYGHQDLAGNVFNVTGTMFGNLNDPRAATSRWSRSGSWETAHPIPHPEHRSPLLRKYWAQGGRCVKN